ncbi:MAG: biotin--[acetyl-CoA-carboxylase] ligase [Oscillospiraceae bacterium]|jgi:BirA family biotin operon repressor/biotin-[acetyl-CoA-carboxylase] ligase|nr:biotin--[acetyl-CoA-carboxylase] ligase [Oscillospiraceae bacterium]
MMETKQKVLELLERQRGEFTSGEQLAATLAVSRNAVWKAIDALRGDGFEIDAATRRGYRLAGGAMSEWSVARHLADAQLPFALSKILVSRSTDSTNAAARALAAAGAGEGTLVVAEEQTAGRGRQGRAFYSPSGTGVYFSVVLRPKLAADRASLITTAAAVAVAGAIEELSGGAASIKWVNDVFVNGKKVCGILTEASLDMESGGVEYAILGIGVNLAPPHGGFPPEIADIAGAVFADSPPPSDARERIVAGTVARFLSFYAELERKPFLDEYRARSFIVGRDVILNPDGEAEMARALSIDDDLRLIVRTADGATRALSSGEVRLKVANLASEAEGAI